MIKKKLSIITIAYNNLYIIKTIDSINRLRKYVDVEHILINGGDKLNDEIVSKVETLVEEPDNGIYDALNKG